MKTLKKIVAEQLKKLGVTQKEIAEKAGLNSAYLSEILSGKKLSVQRRFVPALAYALELEPDVVVAFYGMDHVRFTNPTFIGDTIHLEGKVLNLQSKDDSRGIVFTQMEIKKQTGETVVVAVLRMMVNKTGKKLK